MCDRGLTLRELNFTYPDGGAPALRNIDLNIAPGEFVVLCGPSGGGKTTLLRQLKPALAPHGARGGQILLGGEDIYTLDPRAQASRIGFVLQHPEEQLVTDKVWHELAFGLESLGVPGPAIRRKVAEMAAFFGIQDWLHREVDSLSGGQKQLVALASVMALDPELLLLDEPTSQLDPVAASDFLATLGRLNRELGLTVILTEHRLEEALPLCHRALVLDGGALLADGTPAQVGRALLEGGHRMFRSMPTPMRVWAGAGGEGECPLTVGEGRLWLEERRSSLKPVPLHGYARGGEPAVRMDGVWFRYEEDSPDVLRDFHLEVPSGAIFALMGGNGAGKSTALTLAAGLRKPYRGEVRVRGRVGVLPQQPQSLFVRKTVREELEDMGGDPAAVADLCEIGHLLNAHPFDLSGGEQQRVALAKILLLSPEILLLDEPTKGMDAAFKDKLAAVLQRLRNGGATILMVSHDVEFCAENADRCAMLFDGAIVSEGTPEEFFPGNRFYTTAAHRMARHLLPQAVTAEDVIASCGGTVEERDYAPAKLPPRPNTGPAERPPLSKKRKWAALLLFLLSLAVAYWGLQGEQWDQVAGTLGFSVLALCSLTVLRLGRSQREPLPQRPPSPGGKLALLSVCLLAPLTLWAGHRFLADQSMYLIALLLMAETALPFVVNFEKRRPKARELVLIAVLTAVAVAGRVAFAAIPQFKPLLAVAIVSGAALGCETGFLVGAASMLVSNFYLGQSPNTPFQMFAAGLIGFLGALLFRKLLEPGRVELAVYGFLATLLIYGGIMNPVVLLVSGQPITAGALGAVYLSGLPMDLIHGASTAFFLGAAGPELLEKVARVRRKFGLLEG